MEMAQDLGPRGFLFGKAARLQRRRDQQSTLRKIKMPALVLCGEHDALCPVKRHTFMAELIPYARLEVIADAGHLPTLEQPGTGHCVDPSLDVAAFGAAVTTSGSGV